MSELLITHPRALWSIESIAKWGEYSISHTSQKIVTLPNFPRPIRILGDKGKPRWLAGEVMDFFEGLRPNPDDAPSPPRSPSSKSEGISDPGGL